MCFLVTPGLVMYVKCKCRYLCMSKVLNMIDRVTCLDRVNTVLVFMFSLKINTVDFRSDL